MSDLHLYRARWVLPLTAPPIRDGLVAVRGDRVIGLAEDPAKIPGAAGAPETDLGPAILLPGLVNAHTHLSLSGLGRDLPRGDYYAWMGAVTRAAAELTPEQVAAATKDGLEESWRRGTVALGEITTRPEGAGMIAAHGFMRARVYFEFLGVTRERALARLGAARDLARAQNAARHPRVRAGLSPHAPYSVWPDLWREAVQGSEAARGAVEPASSEPGPFWSTHLAEAPGEDEFLRRGTGPLLDYLRSLGVWDGSFPTPGRSALELLQSAGALGPRALLVHGVHLEPGDLPALAASGASLCLCPRSNAFLGLPPAPVEALHRAGVPLCLGTDSRAGNEDLGLWGEMRALRRLAPGLAAEEVIRMATVNGARALGLPELAGGIQPGAAASLIVVNAEALGDDNPYEFLLREPVESGLKHLLHL